jgi:hypothetical protein
MHHNLLVTLVDIYLETRIMDILLLRKDVFTLEEVFMMSRTRLDFISGGFGATGVYFFNCAKEKPIR